MRDVSKYKPAKPFTCIANSQRELARNAEFNYEPLPPGLRGRSLRLVVFERYNLQRARPKLGVMGISVFDRGLVFSAACQCQLVRTCQAK